MVHALREKAAVSGIGETAYTRGTPKSGLALQLEASLRRIEDAGLEPARHRRRRALFPGRRHRRGFHRQSRPARSHALAVRADGRRDLRRRDPERGDGGRDRRLQARADLGRPHRLFRRARVDPPAAVPAIRAGRGVRGADRHVRAGPALRPGRAPPHGALRHHGAPLRRGRRDDAPARDPQRQRGDEQAAHRRGASRLAHDLRSVPAVRLQPGERRRRGDHHQRRRPRARPEEAAGHHHGRGRGPSRIAGVDRAASGPARLRPRQGGAARATTWPASGRRTSTSPRSTTASPSR